MFLCRPEPVFVKPQFSIHPLSYQSLLHSKYLHLFERLFVIGWENNRDCDITMPLSLKTMEVQIKAKGTNEIRGLEQCRSTGKFKGISGIVKKYSLKTHPVASKKKKKFRGTKTFQNVCTSSPHWVCLYLLFFPSMGGYRWIEKVEFW